MLVMRFYITSKYQSMMIGVFYAQKQLQNRVRSISRMDDDTSGFLQLMVKVFGAILLLQRNVFKRSIGTPRRKGNSLTVLLLHRYIKQKQVRTHYY